MTLKREFFEYLERIEQSVPVREFHARPALPDLVTLRHDIDYSLDVALEMAFWEYRAGLRATYYLLDTTSYWHDPQFLEKCRQLVDFGHEIGLHLNVLAKWYDGEIDDVGADIRQALDRFREAGIDVTGVAAHGDPRCYKGGFINYWCLRELRPDDPASTEAGLSAEGIASPDPRHRLVYPPDHHLRRPGGATLPLWSVDMAELGLGYDAMHVPMDRYFTDSGGGWTRSADPIDADLRRGRLQILIHPIHWRGLPQKTFFLSTARSASTWLAALADAATSSRGVHEHSLNHRFDGTTLVPAKRTYGDLSTLLADDAEVEQLLREARDYMETLADDWAEANVYLVHFLDAVRKVFPDATCVHLHRDPRDVVTSLVSRGWYDTPDDPMRPPVAFDGVREASPFERACHYVATTNRVLLDACDTRIACGPMTSDLRYLEETFASLGIAFYPRLAAPLMGKPRNVGSHAARGSTKWSPDEAAAFAEICGPVLTALGYDRPQPSAADQRPARLKRREQRRPLLRLAPVGTIWSRLPELLRRFAPRRVKEAERAALRITARNCRLVNGLPVTLRLAASRHSHVLFGGGRWETLDDGDGFACAPGMWFSGELELALTDGVSPALYCLAYDSEGRQANRKLVGVFSRHAPKKSFAFRPPASSPRFNLALYFSAADAERTVEITSIRLDEVTG